MELGEKIYCFAQHVLLQPVAEDQDDRFIRDHVADQLDTGLAAHGGHLDQGLSHRWAAERVPMLQEISQWIGRPAAFLARFGVVGLDQVAQGLPGQHRFYLRETLFPIALLLGLGQLAIREAELLAANHPSPGIRLQRHCCVDVPGFPETP